MAQRKPKKCHYCKRQLTAPTDLSRTAYTRDHIKPKAHGGKHTVPCCRQCNQLKGDFSIRDWRIVMETYPLWYRRFSDRGHLLRTIKADLHKVRVRKEIQRVRSMQVWPDSICIPAPKISGLNYRKAA